MKTSQQVETHPGKVNIQDLMREAAILAVSEGVPPDQAASFVVARHDDLLDKTKCANCGRNMKIIGYEADLHNALLLLAFGRKVKENLQEGMAFTDANKVHLPTLDVSDAVKKRITQCDYLRWIKQPDNLRRTGFWSITDLGFAALRGDAVPRIAYYWNGNLVRRSNDSIRLAGMFEIHRSQVAKAAALRRKVRDHTSEIGEYDPNEWSQFGGTQSGQLF